MTTANMEVDSANTNDDDMTVVTGSDSVRPPAQRSWQTLTIKISFKSKDAIPVTTMANNTMTLLDSMKQSFQQDIKIFDNHDKEVRDFTAQEPSKFTQLYDIEVVKGRRKRKRKHFSFIVFCIQTKHALSDIRRHSNVAHNAQRLGAKIQFHAWPEGIKDVATAGFISGPIPRYTMPSAIQDQLLKILTTDHASGDKPEQIPDFRCVMAPISAVNSKTNRRYSCQAYTIQVQRKDYSALTRLLRKSFNRETQGIQFFEFYLRREDPDSVCKAVVRQCARESNHMVIAVQGILPSLPLSGVKHRLCQEFPAIKDILPTPKTNARNTSGKVLGRYNFLCESSNFSSLAHDLQARFSHVYETKVLSKAPTSSTADTMVDPAIVSNFRQRSDDESSGLTSRKSYLSSLQESFADFSIDDVDVPFEIVTQPPPNQPKKSYATAASPGTKPPANVTSDKQEILQLREELKSAFTKIAQLTALVEKLTVDQSVPSTQSTPPSAILSQDKVQKMINDTIHVAQSSVREELEGFRTEIRQFERSSASAAGANSPFRKMPRGEAGRGRGLGRGSGS